MTQMRRLSLIETLSPGCVSTATANGKFWQQGRESSRDWPLAHKKMWGRSVIAGVTNDGKLLWKEDDYRQIDIVSRISVHCTGRAEPLDVDLGLVGRLFPSVLFPI
jgi:hypothetical protein